MSAPALAVIASPKTCASLGGPGSKPKLPQPQPFLGLVLPYALSVRGSRTPSKRGVGPSRGERPSLTSDGRCAATVTLPCDRNGRQRARRSHGRPIVGARGRARLGPHR